METRQRQLEIYLTEDGRAPFSEWLDSLRDERAYAKILVRLDRVKLGNLGDWAAVEGGVAELRIHYGPGYRVYFGEVGTTIILLLCGGDKSTQAQDIRTAHAYWKDFKRRSGHASQ